MQLICITYNSYQFPFLLPDLFQNDFVRFRMLKRSAVLYRCRSWSSGRSSKATICYSCHSNRISKALLILKRETRRSCRVSLSQSAALVHNHGKGRLSMLAFMVMPKASQASVAQGSCLLPCLLRRLRHEVSTSRFSESIIGMESQT